MGKRYKIGDFAKNLGVSAGFLKHHESYGLMKPQVMETGYRYYEFAQAMLVVQCIRLQNMGFTSKEISDILNRSTQVDIHGLLMEKREEIRQQVCFYQELLQYLDRQAEEYERAEAWGFWSVACPEPFYYVENATEGEFIENENLQEVSAHWNRFMPLVETCARFELTSQEASLEAVGTWNMGLRISQSVGDRLGIFRNETVRLISLPKCLLYYSGEPRKKNADNKQKAVRLILEKPLEICRKHSLIPAGDIYSVQEFSSTAQSENYVREMVIIPLKA